MLRQKQQKLNLGGNAIAVLALTEYTNIFNDNDYLELLNKLGNGILEMQNEDGGFYHILDPMDFSRKEEFRTIYYDGEAAFALVKLYGLTEDEKYLDAAIKACEYFIENEYEKHDSQWILYTMNEITKYVSREDFYEFGIRNVKRNIASMRNKQRTCHTDFEFLVASYELYKRISEKSEIEIDFENLVSAIHYRANYQLNSYMFPEVAMYFEHPNQYVNSFYIKHDRFRIRIDDIQHSISGYCMYYKSFF